MSAIDLFAGAGGFSLAAHQAGLDVLAAIELDAAAASTYRKNIIERLGQNTHLINDDILKVDPHALRNQLGLQQGDLDLILGGPPCQGFSTHRINNAGVDDPRNQLLLRYFDFVREFRPQTFLVENVSGLFWAKHAKYLESFRRLAAENHYTIHYCGILNAKDYGVPQNRKRAFIIGVDNRRIVDSLQFPPAPMFFSPSSREVIRSGLPSWRTASSVFEPLTDELIERYIQQYFLRDTNLSEECARALLRGLEHGEAIAQSDPCNINMKPTETMLERFKALRLNGSRADLPKKFHLKCHTGGHDGHKDVYGRMLIHTPSNTITTGCMNPSKGRYVHPWKNHGITLRHAARLQTFPDDFVFTGSATDQAKQIGNAVPVQLGEVLINQIINVICR